MTVDYIKIIEEQIDSIFENGSFDEEAVKEEVSNDNIISFYYNIDDIILLISTYWELKMTRYMISLNWIDDNEKFEKVVRSKLDETRDQVDMLMNCILNNLGSLAS